MLLLKIILAFIFFILQIQSASFCSPGGELCFTSTAQGTDMLFEITSKVNGWVGIGFGTKMAGADIIMSYKIGTKLIVSSREGTGEFMPEKKGNQNQIKVLPADSPKGTTVFKFTRPLTTSDQGGKAIKKGPTDMIWAFSPTPVTNENTLIQHSDYGTFKIDLFSADSVGGGVSRTTIITIHAVFMIAAWAFFTPLGVFIARHLKGTLGQWWYRLHLGFLSFTVVLTIIGFALIVYGTTTHFQIAHSIIGLIIVISAVGQSILGFIIDRLFDPYRSYIPWWDKFHWWQGRIIFLVALVNIYLGLAILGVTLYYILFSVLVLIILVTFSFGHYYYGHSHHKEDSYQNEVGNQPSMSIGNPMRSNFDEF